MMYLVNDTGILKEKELQLLPMGLNLELST